MTPAQLSAAKEVCKKRTPGEWAWGRLIDEQAGDYVVWRHRGAIDEASGSHKSGEQRRVYVGNVGGLIEPVIEADAEDVLANQVFEGEAADAAYIAATTHPETGYEAALVEIERLRKLLNEKEAPGE